MNQKPRSLTLSTLVVLFVSIFLTSLAPVMAEPTHRLVTNEEPMPTRPPTATPRSPAIATPIGAAISLHLEPKPVDATSIWTVVQWLGSDGTWHDVEGWQGRLDRNGVVHWWVAPYNKSQSQFRWVIYASSTRDIVMAVSPSFELPRQPGEIVSTGAIANATASATLTPTP